MKCRSCDEILTDEEAVRKYPNTTEYIDLCNHCLSYIREDLGLDLNKNESYSYVELDDD